MESINKEKITIEVTFSGTIDKIWKAWTDPFLIKNWFGSDPNGKVLDASLKVYKGGCYEITFADSDKTEHTCSGIYTLVEEFSTLAFSWEWRSEPGEVSYVDVSLISKKNNTIMLFQHSNLYATSKHSYQEGWRSTFSKLERFLTQPL